MKQFKKVFVLCSVVIVVLTFFGVFSYRVYAVPSTSTNYKLDPQGLNAFGGQGTSTHYSMVSSGGEAVVGNGSGGSYKLSSGYVGQLQQSIELNLTASNTQAYYPLNTNTGIQAYDATANNLSGTLSGSAGWGTGKIGQAATFNGSSSYIQTDYPTQVTNEFTYSGWFYVDSFSAGWESVFGDFQHTGSAGGATGVNFVPRNGSIQICAGDSTGSYVLGTHCNINFASGAVTTGSWIFGTLTYDGTTLKAYVNGSQIGSTPRSISHASAKFVLGRWGVTYNNYYFDGSIDEVKIFNRALNATEVRNIYDANTAGIANAVTVPEVVPGVPQTVGMDMTVITDAGGYDAAISQNNNLTHSDTSTTIAALSGGSITTPVLWDDGTTKGLGFTLISGMSIPAKWGSGPVNYKYAPLPSSATTFFSRTGLSAGAKEVTNMQLKLDVPTSQKSGQYTNIVTVTVTAKP